MKRLAALLAVVLALAGCGERQAKKRGDEPKKEERGVGARRSHVQTVRTGARGFVDCATGRTPIERGAQLQKQIREIQEKRDAQLEEVMDR